MATEIGQAYYRVFLKIDKAQAEAVRKQLGQQLSKQIDDVNAKSVEANRNANAQMARDNETFTKSQTKNSTTRRTAEERDTLAVERARTQAYAEEARRNVKRLSAVNEQERAETGLSGLRSRFASKFDQETNKNGTALQHLATNFRTFGTIFRGLSVGGAVLSGFSLLQDVLGGIIAAGPIAAAAIALIPPAVAAVGVEAIILKGAFKGVGTAVKDAFDPSRAKQFQQELKKLAPAARTFVENLAKAKGILPNIQQTFFSVPQMQQAGRNVKTFFEGIKGNFKALVAANGGLAGGIANAITGTKGTKSVDSFLGSLATLLTEITPSVTKLTGSFLGFITRVANQVSGPGGHTIGHFLDSVSNFLDRVNVPGLFDKASRAWHAFGGVISSVGGTISGIIKAFGGTDNLGAGFFKNIGGLFRELDKFSNSATGQVFLKQLVGTLNALSRLANGVLKDALGFLAGAFAGLYPAIKPFTDSLKKLADAVLTPQFGQALGVLASSALTLATHLINFLTPAIKDLVNFLVAHPKVLDTVAIGIGLIYTALKVGKGVKSVAGAIQTMNTALNFFKNPKKILTGMGEVAVGETAVGDAGGKAAGKTKVGALTSSLSGKAGLYGALAIVGGGLAYIAASLADPAGSRSFHKHVNTIKGDLEGLISGRTSFKQLRNDIVSLGIEMGGKGWYSKGLVSIGTFVTTAVKDIKGAFNSVKNFITKTIPGWFSSMASSIDRVLNGIRKRVSQFINDDIIGTANKVKTFVTHTVPGWFDSARHDISHSLDATRDRIGTFVEKNVKATFNGLKDFVTKTVPGWFKSMWHSTVDNVGGMVNGIATAWNKVVGVFSAPVNSVVNNVLGGLATAWNIVDGALGGKHKMSKPHFHPPATGAGALPNNPYHRGAFAGGGFVDPRYGGPTQDNVYLPPSINSVHPGIAVSGGEYVLNAASVKRIPLGYLDALNQYGNRAVSGDPSAIHIFDPTKQRYRDGGLVDGFASGGGVPAAARARVGGVLSWLQSIAGRIPYVLGGNGPNSFDCSSLVGNVWARLTGNPINRRYFVTGTEASWLLGHGFAPGADPSGFTVGLTSPPEHTVGILGGHRFEAAHTGTKMRFDDGAANALHFARLFHMIGMSGVGGSFGLPAALQSVSTAAKFASFFGNIVNKFKLPRTGYTPEASLVGPQTVNHMAAVANPLIKQAVAAAQAAASSGFGAGTALGHVGSGMIANWIAQASKFANIPASWVPGIETIIRRESGGNPNAINRTDSNARAGHPSQGLMQTIPSTFARYHAAGTSNNILDPVANIAAAVNYIHSRYGSIFNVQQADPNRPPHGYAAGGPVLVRDQGGPVPPGLSTIFNGTGGTEWINDPHGPGHCVVSVSIDGVDVTSKAHVTVNNKAVAASLNRRSK